MKVFLLCRTVLHPDNKNINAPQLGDIVQIRRVDKTLWGKELSYFTVVQVDLNIPCGKFFKKIPCKSCADNDVTKCEFQKYMQPEFNTDGSVLKKRRYKAVYSPPQEIIDKINLTTEKTAEDEGSILIWAVDYEQSKSIIVDKKAVI